MKVLKIGGEVASDHDVLQALAAEMKQSGPWILVHGGGAEVTRLTRQLGLQPEFKDGVRVTSEEEMQYVDVRAGEWPVASLMFTYFFLVITSFWVLKPIKKTLFLSYYADQSLSLLGWELAGPDAELIAKVVNMFVAAVAATATTARATSWPMTATPSPSRAASSPPTPAG